MRSMKALWAAIAIACVSSFPVYADCQLPSAPSKIPDGKIASEQEMATAMQTAKEYNSDVETYLKCLEFELKQNHISSTEEKRLHNDAVDILTRIVNKFNDQLRTFKAKSG